MEQDRARAHNCDSGQYYKHFTIVIYGSCLTIFFANHSSGRSCNLFYNCYLLVSSSQYESA